MENKNLNLSVKDVVEAITIIDQATENGFHEIVTEDDVTLKISKEDGVFKVEMIKVTPEEKFDDSEVKALVSEYRKSIEKLDDCVFVEAMEEVSNHIDTTYFDNLLHKSSYNEKEADTVCNMIDISSEIISNTLKKKISNFLNLCIEF